MIHVSKSSVLAPGAEGQCGTFDFHGLTIRDYVPGRVESASVAEIVVDPGIKHATGRSTRSDKFYLGLEGQILFQVEGKGVPLEPGDLLVIQKNEWFSYENTSTGQARLVIFHVPPFGLESEEFKK
jgi:mannose-6-phosphate isomerase-like protein (cupin superfamily)